MDVSRHIANFMQAPSLEKHRNATRPRFGDWRNPRSSVVSHSTLFASVVLFASPATLWRSSLHRQGTLSGRWSASSPRGDDARGGASTKRPSPAKDKAVSI